MKPTVTSNDELLLPNGKTYIFHNIALATENTDVFTNKPSEYQIGSLSNSKC